MNDQTYIFEAPEYWYLLFAIPVMLLAFLLMLWWRKSAIRKFASPGMIRKLAPARSIFKPWLKFVTLMAGFIFLVLAIVNLKAGSELKTVTREGVDIVFALDISKSMLAEDVAPSRLQKAQQLVSQILNSLASDRIGLIAYAGSAVPQLPITTDYGSAKMFLQSLDTDLVSSQGTAIAEAIQLADSYYAEESEASKVLIIISDGEDHEGDAIEMAEEAADKGVRIITIGVGTQKGGPIPLKERGVTRRFKKNNEGETVITRLNAETLTEIAEAGNGAYIDGTITAQVIEELRDQLERIEKVEFDTQQYADYESQYQWFLILAIFFFLLDIFYLERKTGWVKRLNLFNE